MIDGGSFFLGMLALACIEGCAFLAWFFNEVNESRKRATPVVAKRNNDVPEDVH